MSKIDMKGYELRKKGYKYLGYENGWGGLPKELESCGHAHNQAARGNLHDSRKGEEMYWCNECMFYFEVDIG